jgi:hypothetical protein
MNWHLISPALAKNLKMYSPAMFPKAHTACSQTFGALLDRSLIKGPIALCFTTSLVWAEVPEAMFVKAQAASNCNSDLKKRMAP